MSAPIVITDLSIIAKDSTRVLQIHIPSMDGVGSGLQNHPRKVMYCLLLLMWFGNDGQSRTGSARALSRSVEVAKFP